MVHGNDKGKSDLSLNFKTSLKLHSSLTKMYMNLY